MQASKENPIYTAYIISGDRKYNVTGATDSIDLSSQQKQVAASANLSLADVDVDGKKLSAIISPRDRVYIHADDGSQSGEVFRGFVWTISKKESMSESNLTLKCYDNLIYFQESEESEFFAAGRSTKDVVGSLCSKWGVNLSYDYESITHSKLVLRGALADILTADVLDLVKDRTGQRYVVYSEKDEVHVATVGSNTTVYTIKAGNNATDIKISVSMDGMVTKVVILGKADNDGRTPVEAAVKGDTATYGTLQKLINRNENTSLSDAQKEAASILAEKGAPQAEYEIKTIDIPWIKKGDQVKVDTDPLAGTFIVTGIDREIGNKGKNMTLTIVPRS